MCERHEKGVLQDHQRAIAKMGQYKKKKMSATVSSSEVGGCKNCGSYLNLAWSVTCMDNSNESHVQYMNVRSTLKHRFSLA